MSYDDGNEMVGIDDVLVVRELERSIVVQYEGEELIIPKSQIGIDSEVQGEGDEGRLVIPQWLAEDRGML